MKYLFMALVCLTLTACGNTSTSSVEDRTLEISMSLANVNFNGVSYIGTPERLEGVEGICKYAGIELKLTGDNHQLAEDFTNQEFTTGGFHGLVQGCTSGGYHRVVAVLK